MEQHQQCRRSRCGRIPMCWSRVDTTLLLCILVGTFTLTITASVIWTSYLQTANYVRGQCMVLDVHLHGGLQQCTSGPAAICTIGDVATLLPANTVPSILANSSINPSHDTIALNASINTTTTPILTRSSTTLLYLLPQCAGFPCSKVIVEYAILTSGTYQMGTGQLYSSYTQLRAYPECTYSACDGANYSENEATIFNLLSQRLSMLISGQTFACYVNIEDETLGHQTVLEDIPYSTAIAVNSVLWPAVFSSLCLVVLIGHVIWSTCPSCRRRLVRTKRSSSSSPATSSESGRRPSDMAAATHRRHVSATSPQPAAHTELSLVRRQFPVNGNSMDNFSNRQTGITNISLVEDNFAVWFTPPPYDLVNQTATSGTSTTTIFSSMDPPSYQEAVLSTADAEVVDPASYF